MVGVAWTIVDIHIHWLTFRVNDHVDTLARPCSAQSGCILVSVMNRKYHGKTRYISGCVPVIGVKNLKDGETINHFFKRFHETDLSQDFGVYRLSLDSLRPHIQEYIINQGLSSLFYSYMTCDAIMHPGFATDEIETIVLGIMSKLDGVKHLLLIDAFFYDDKPECLLLLEKIIRAISSKLEKVTIITHGKRTSMRPGMHNVFSKVAPGIQINDVVTEDFHDRYWIDVDNSKGVILGTSLNGSERRSR